jgi:hypothetical protein
LETTLAWKKLILVCIALAALAAYVTSFNELFWPERSISRHKIDQSSNNSNNCSDDYGDEYATTCTNQNDQTINGGESEADTSVKQQSDNDNYCSAGASCTNNNDQTLNVNSNDGEDEE